MIDFEQTRAWVAAHPGYFAFWGGILAVYLAERVISAWFLRRQVDRLIEARFVHGGFADFGKGTPARLHGRETIVPERSRKRG